MNDVLTWVGNFCYEDRRVPAIAEWKPDSQIMVILEVPANYYDIMTVDEAKKKMDGLYKGLTIWRRLKILSNKLNRFINDGIYLSYSKQKAWGDRIYVNRLVEKFVESYGANENWTHLSGTRLTEYDVLRLNKIAKIIGVKK